MTSPTQKTVVIIEDDANLNLMLTDQIGELGYTAHGANSRAEARAIVEHVAPDLMLVDMRLPDCDGFDLIEEFSGQCPVIVLTAYGTVDQAVRAVRSGASDYLTKPVSFENLELSLKRAFDTLELERDVRFWQSQAKRSINETIIGKSEKTQQMRGLIELHAAAGSTVLIEGGSGVGKELLARAIHEMSDRAKGRFVPIDCDATQEQLVAAELFGHEKGAYPGADFRREGMLELADKGTIYLGDIAELSLALQSKLLRVMETGRFRRLGGAQDLPADIRIIAATGSDLRALVQAGRFRSELFYRLSAFCIAVPPLCDRREDIPDLVQHFLETRSFHRGLDKRLADESLEILERYEWPGNVRELKNAIERGLIMSGTSAEILPQHLAIGVDPIHASRAGAEVNLSYEDEPALEQIRDDYIALLLDRHMGNRSKVAGILGISERSLYRAISKLSSS